MQMTLKRGRVPSAFAPHKMRALYRTGITFASFGAPPPISHDFAAPAHHATRGNWGMFLNNQIGSCTAAGSLHYLMARTAGAGKIVVPTDIDAMTIYKATGGYVPGRPDTDRGADQATVCEYLRTTGVLGHKSDGHVPIVFGHVGDDQIARIKWATQIFGGVRLGVNLPASADDQFYRGDPWDLGGDQTLTGGHDLLATHYDEEYLYVVTWGRGYVPLTWAWVREFLEEAHVEAYPDAVRPAGTTPAGFHYATVVRNLGIIGA